MFASSAERLVEIDTMRMQVSTCSYKMVANFLLFADLVQSFVFAGILVVLC